MWVASLIPYDGETVESFHSNYKSAWNALGCIIADQIPNGEFKQRLITLYRESMYSRLIYEVGHSGYGSLMICEVEIFDSHPTPNFN